MTANEDSKANRDAVRHRWRFGVVLGASLLLAIAQPLTSELFGEEGSFDVFFSLVIGAVLLLVLEEREHRVAATSGGLAAFLGIWIGYAIGGPAGRTLGVAAHLLAACVIAFALYRILRTVLAQHASADAIFRAVCGYLLLGIIWALFYSALETASPGSFNVADAAKPTGAAGRLDRSILSYYSFVTLSTVGYGDVTPVNATARTLAWIEAVTGQFYLAILVAGLVGFKVSQAMRQ